MASGLDLLLGGQAAQGPQNGLDMLLAPPAATAPPVATAQGTKLGGVMQGVNDVQNGAAQWLYNALPQSVQNAGDSVDHWMYDKTGGAIGTKPGMTFNNAVADQNQNYEASKTANGRDGIDWMRALGAGGAQVGLGALSGGTSMGPVAAGVAGGALSPVTDMSQGSDNTFAGGAAKNIAVGGAVGGGLGVIGKGIAGAISPQISATARALMDSGVQLTPGQMMGGMAKSAEDKLTSLPIVGDMIKGAQGRGVESLNIATYNRVLSPLKDAGFQVNVPKTAGRDAVESVTTQVKDAYNQLLPKLSTQMDLQFAQSVGHLTEMVSSGNLGQAEAQQFSKILQTKVLDKFQNPTSTITGETLKTMESQLGELAGQYRSVPLGGAISELQSQVRSLVERSNPQYAGQLSKINEAFANLTRVQTAAASQGAANGVFSAAQLASAVKGGDKTVRDNAYAQGKARMQDLSDPAKEMLTSSVGDSGTTGRAATAGALGAILSNPAHLLNPAVLGTVLPTAAAYSGAGQRVLNAVATPRSAQTQALAEALRRLTDNSAAPMSAGAIAGR